VNLFSDQIDLHSETTAWRRYLHQNPELGYRLEKTAQFVAEKLASFGINHIETGIAETGIVALIEGRGGEGPTIGLRADMDALPIHEASNKPWSSAIPGKMHACGHDGHTAMLLGAAKHLSRTRNFKGAVALIFQPAEEEGLGGKKMVEAGVMERFGISQVFGLHCDPSLEIGTFATRYGALFAGLYEFDIMILGTGGHASEPHKCVDPIVVASQIVLGLQTIVSRAIDPLDSLVVTVTSFHAGEGYNTIPDRVALKGTVRTASEKPGASAGQRIRDCVEAITRGFGGSYEFAYRSLEPVTFNHQAETELAIKAATDLVTSASVSDNYPLSMGSEDFSYMSAVRPGSYMMIGNGLTPTWHNSAFDFNDEALPYGIAYWVKLVERALGA